MIFIGGKKYSSTFLKILNFWCPKPNRKKEMSRNQVNPERISPLANVKPGREVIRLTRDYRAFRENAIGIDKSLEDEVQQHFLRGTWANGTLKHYNSAVTKLLRFVEVKRLDKESILPISVSTLKNFIVWLSRKQEQNACDDESVSASTIKAYLAGIKAWHLFHEASFPREADAAVSGLLKASRKIEAEFKDKDKKRPPVLVSHFPILLEELRDKGELGRAVLAIALTAFWGAARLGELISDDEEKRLPTWGDVTWGQRGEFARIELVNAKKAGPGEKQYIHLHKQDSKLDPVRALEAWYWFKERKPSDVIFNLKSESSKTQMKKREVIDYLRRIWNKHRPTDSQILFGHSFRIGGASLRWNLGTSREELMKYGRWKSDTYKIYLRKFSSSELAATVKLLQELRTDE